MMPMAKPIKTLRKKYRCHRLVMRDNSSKLNPDRRIPTNMNFLDPYLSLKLPTMGAISPPNIVLTETEPEIAVLDQPNILIRGLTKTPKLY